MPRVSKSKVTASSPEKASRRMAEIDVELGKLEDRRSALQAERKQCEAIVQQVRNEARAKVVESVIKKVGLEHEEALMKRLTAMSSDELMKLVGGPSGDVPSSQKAAPIADPA